VCVYVPPADEFGLLQILPNHSVVLPNGTLHTDQELYIMRANGDEEGIEK